jgi:hypothetical protein
MSDWDERARQLIDIARPLHSPNAADAARVRAALGLRFAADPGLIPRSLPAAASPAAGLAKLLVVFAAGSSVGFAAGLYAAGAFEPAPAQRISVPVPALSVAVPSVPDRPLAPVVISTPEVIAGSDSGVQVEPRTAAPSGAARIARVPRPSRAPLAAAPGTGNALKAELEGLRRAQELLHEGDAAWAVARLDELDRQSTSSALLEERLATRVMAECALGRGASAALEALARKFPQSAHLERIRSSCQKAAPPGVPAGKSTGSQTESPPSKHE